MGGGGVLAVPGASNRIGTPRARWTYLLDLDIVLGPLGRP